MEKIKLLDFQKEGAEFLAQRNFAGLFDEMGLGKTPQAIVASINLKYVLVICPACATYNWQKEFIKFAGRKSEIAGPKANFKSKILITSFSYLNENSEKFLRRKWQLVIVDESHFIKEPTSKRTKIVLGKNGIVHNTQKMWFLSGTPAPNHAGELWTMLYTVGVTRLSYDGFVARYCESYKLSRYGRVQITGSNTEHTPELKESLKKFAIRRKADLLDLPPIRHNHVYLEPKKDPMHGFSKAMKQKISEEFLLLKEKLDFGIYEPTQDKILGALSFLSQSTPSLRRYHGLKKALGVAELVDFELRAGLYDKIVIFAIHKDVIKVISDHLEPHGVIVYNSETSSSDKKEAIPKFQNDKTKKVFIGNIKACGVALTMTASNQVLFTELEWTPGDNAQAAKRCHRYGQTNSVNVRYATLSGSFDQKITATLMRKTKELATFID